MVEERRSCQERGRGVPQASRLGGAGALCKRDERGVCDRGGLSYCSKNAPSEKLSASCPVKNLRVVRDTRPHEVAISLSSFAMLPVISGHVPIDELTKYR